MKAPAEHPTAQVNIHQKILEAPIQKRLFILFCFSLAYITAQYCHGQLHLS